MKITKYQKLSGNKYNVYLDNGEKIKLYENFMNINNIANINLLLCYKNLFSKEGLIKNVGFYIIITIIIIFPMTANRNVISEEFIIIYIRKF